MRQTRYFDRHNPNAASSPAHDGPMHAAGHGDGEVPHNHPEPDSSSNWEAAWIDLGGEG